MKIINHYRVEIVTKTGICEQKLRNDFIVDEVFVLAENEYKYVLEDDDYTHINKGGSSYATVINEPSINSRTGDSCFGTGITYNLYTLNDKKTEDIKKEIAEYIDEKYGSFASINLDFIKKYDLS